MDGRVTIANEGDTATVGITPYGSPRQVRSARHNVPGTVVLDVHAAHVAHLPEEELGDVDELNGHGGGQARVEAVAAVDFDVLEAEADERDGPEHHTHAAVGEELDVPAEDAGVQLHALWGEKGRESRVRDTGSDRHCRAGAARAGAARATHPHARRTQ